MRSRKRGSERKSFDLPILDGIEAMNRIRRMEALRGVPIVAVTAHHKQWVI